MRRFVLASSCSISTRVNQAPSEVLICLNLRSARQGMPAEQSGGRPIGYSLIATPLKEATPRELEVMDAAVFAEGYFAFGATIKVIEDGLGYTRWTMARKSPMLTTRGEATEREDRVISVCYTKAGSSPTGISLFDLPDRRTHTITELYTSNRPHGPTSIVAGPRTTVCRRRTRWPRRRQNR